jgi:hypothetical protein
MIFTVRSKRVFASFVVAAAAAFYASAPFATAQTAETPAAQAASASPSSLDFEYFNTRVEPIFLKRRPPHARCYTCHVRTTHTTGLNLEPLSPGSSFWTEEQSRRNFQTVSKLVVPGDPSSSMFPMHPLAPEVGGDSVRVHGGGRQFRSQDDLDFQTIADWIRGKKAGASSMP